MVKVKTLTLQQKVLKGIVEWLFQVRCLLESLKVGQLHFYFGTIKWKLGESEYQDILLTRLLEIIYEME